MLSSMAEGRSTLSGQEGVRVPGLRERVVHAAEGDVKLLQPGGGEEPGSPLVEGVPAVKQGDGGEIHRSQFPQTAAHGLCRRRKVSVSVSARTGGASAALGFLPRMSAPPG